MFNQSKTILKIQKGVTQNKVVHTKLFTSIDNMHGTKHTTEFV